jgi:hypothetical protein
MRSGAGVHDRKQIGIAKTSNQCLWKTVSVARTGGERCLVRSITSGLRSVVSPICAGCVPRMQCPKRFAQSGMAESSRAPARDRHGEDPIPARGHDR